MAGGPGKWLRQLPGLGSDDELTVTMAQILYGGLLIILLFVVISLFWPEQAPPSDAPLLPEIRIDRVEG